MKKVILIASLALFITRALAQPMLTADANGLQPGYTENFYYTTNSNLTAGAGGAGQLWDFSAFTYTRSTINTFGDCAATPYCSSFPGATVAEDDSLSFLLSQPAQKYHFYYKSNSAMLAKLGEHSSAVYSMVFDQPEVLLTFPFTYGNQVQSRYVYADSGTAGDYTVGVDSVTADGWGTLKTPVGTFSNVLRVKTVRTYYDSTAALGAVQNEKDYFYRWYSPAYRDYLFTYEDYEPFGGQGLIVGYTDQGSLSVSGNSISATSFQVLPNPASGQAQLLFTAAAAQQATITITDMTGRAALLTTINCNAGTNSAMLALGNIAPGIYLVQLTAEGMHLTTKLVVE